MLDEMLKRVRPHVLASRVRMVLTCDVEKSLQACNVPTLYLQGTRDWVVPRGNLKRIQRVQPQTFVEKINSSHMVLQQNSSASASAILTFVDALQTRARGTRPMVAL